MNPLQSFYNNVSERDAVKQFLIDNLKELAAIRAFKNESTEGIYEAKTAIEAAFVKLEEAFGAKKEPTKRITR